MRSMMHKPMAMIIVSSLLVGLALASPVAAQEATHSNPQNGRIDIETSLLWPFIPGVNIIQAKILFPLLPSPLPEGQLSTGVLFRPGVYRETEGQFSEIGLNLGWRQYLLAGWHIEAALWPSFGWLTGNVVDGKDYQSFGLATEAYTGYRFEFRLFGADWYLTPQVGIGYTPWMSNPWPTTTTENAPFFVGNILFGLRLP